MCGEVKPISNFYESLSKTKLGFPTYTAYCKNCSNVYVVAKRSLKVKQGKCARCGKLRERIDGYYCNNCLIKSNAEGKERLHQRKRRAIEYLGGKCVECGLKTDALSVYEFHHIIGEKEENLKVLLGNGSWKKIVKELDKCILLCANCHRTIHWEEGNGSLE